MAPHTGRLAVTPHLTQAATDALPRASANNKGGAGGGAGGGRNAAVAAPAERRYVHYAYVDEAKLIEVGSPMPRYPCKSEIVPEWPPTPFDGVDAECQPAAVYACPVARQSAIDLALGRGLIGPCYVTHCDSGDG